MRERVSGGVQQGRRKACLNWEWDGTECLTINKAGVMRGNDEKVEELEGEVNYTPSTWEGGSYISPLVASVFVKALFPRFNDVAQ